MYSRPLFFTIATICILTVFPHHIHAEQQVTVGVYNNKPTIFIGEDGAPDGLFIDVLEYIAAEKGWQLHYVEDHFSALLEKTRKGQIDLLPAIAYAENRTAFLDYNYETIMANWAELYVPSGQNITTLLDLKGKKVAVKQGDIHFTALKKLIGNFNIDCRFLETDGYETVFEMLNAQYADIGVVNRLFGNARKQDYRVAETPVIFNPIEMRFAVQKGTRQELLNSIDTAMIKMKADQNSAYYNSINRWFLADSTPLLPYWFYRVIYLSLGTAVIFLLVAILFRRQVGKRTKELELANASLYDEVRQRTITQTRLHKFARVVEASSDAMALLDLEHRHQLVNSAYRNLFFNVDIYETDTLLQEVIGKQFFTRKLQEPISDCLRGKTVHLQLKPPQKLNDKTIWSMSLNPYYLADNIIDGYVINIRDISSQIALQTRLRNAHKMEAIGLLAGGVAHDLNNILSGIVSYPDLLLMNRPDNDPMTGPLTTIKKSGERAAAIVQDLLALARRGLGHTHVLQLNQLIEDFLKSPERIELLRENRDISVQVRLDSTLKHIYASDVHLQKVVMNLFNNAVEAMPYGGTITITTETRSFTEEYRCYEAIPAGDYTTLQIKDTGIGMSPTEISRIFEPFYSSKILGKSGTGLGMAVVWGTVKDHQGYIDIDSTPGEGTQFSLFFPTTDEPIIHPDNNTINLQGNQETILVVDDLASQRDLTRQILEQLNYRVELAASGEEALEFCRLHTIDLLLLDMMMPGGLDGLETYKAILQLYPEQKVIITSGFSETERVKQALQLGEGTYLRKPYTVETLGRTILNQLTKKRSS